MESSGGEDLYVMGNPGKFVVCVLGYAVLGSVVWILLQKEKPEQNFPLDRVCGTVNTCFTGGIL